jgi:hypothetical protein
MFNKTIINQRGTKLVPFTKEVNEHRAPTDESVKLLMEMEDAALSKVFKCFEIENTELHGIVWQVNKSRFSRELVIGYKLNNKIENITIPVDIKIFNLNPEKAIHRMIEIVKKGIADHISDKILGGISLNHMIHNMIQ